MEENEKNRWIKVFFVISIVVIGFVVFISLYGFELMGNDMRGGMMGFGWPFMLLPVILIIVLIYVITEGDTKSNYHGEDSLQILERRYANGEISRSEYLKIKDDIKWNYPKEIR